MRPDSMPAPPPPRALILVAFAAIYIVWGSTYLAIRVAVETLPPFLMAACRFLVAGCLLYAWMRFRGVPAPSRIQWANGALIGTLLCVGGNGLVVWSEQTMASSFAALLVALTPVWFALLDWLRPRGVRPSGRTVCGILVGFAGVVLLVTGRGSETVHTAMHFMAVPAVIAAGIFWAVGSLLARHSAKADSPWMNASLQMLCGGVGLLLVALLFGEPVRTNWSGISTRSLAALFYLITCGSLIAYSAYVWLLKVSTPTRVSTYAYVNPVIAVLLGWAVLGEAVTPRVLWATLVIVAGVVIITLPRSAMETLLRRPNAEVVRGD